MKKVSIITLFLTSLISYSAMANWPHEAGAKVPANAAELPTMLKPVDKSLSELLDNGGEVVSAQISEHGPIVTLKKNNVYIICTVIGAGDGRDQNVSTSRCYALN